MTQVLCSGLKYAITNLLDDFQPMLPDLCNLIVAILNSKCVAPAIDIAKSVSSTKVETSTVFQITFSSAIHQIIKFSFIHCSAYFYTTKIRHALQ